MALSPGSTQTTTTVATNATPQTITPAGLAAAEMINVVNLGPGPAIVSWWDFRGLQLQRPARSPTPSRLWAGATGGLPWPSGGNLTLSSATPGQVARDGSG